VWCVCVVCVCVWGVCVVCAVWCVWCVCVMCVCVVCGVWCLCLFGVCIFGYEKFKDVKIE